MRGLGKLIFGFAILTSALLIYVHERVEVLRVSYRINDTSSLLAQRSEEYRRLKYEVTQLRSPQNLEKNLEKLSLSLTLPKEIQVLRVPASIARPQVNPISMHPASHNLFDFLGQWIQVAQARTEQ